MHRLCEASDILYVHAIQPNQHDPGSKPLTDKEQEMMLPGSANNAHRMYAPLIPLGYPKLRDAGRALREAGVRNIDLTQLFAQTSESLYVDSCCHVNPTGSEMLAAALAEYVVEQLPE